MPRRGVFGALLAICLFAAGPGAAAETVTVFAAASLTNALQDIGKAYEARTGIHVVFSFASSSILAKQVEAGAPAQIFASADTQWMDDVERHGLLEPGTRASVLGNELVLIAPKESPAPPQAIGASTDWAKLLGAEGRLCVGDPDHVPAGIYARQALTRLGAWAALEPRLARAEDVRGALALVEQGQAPLGIVYASDAKVSAGVKVLGAFPPSTHSPIVYPFAIVKGQARPAVRAFLSYIRSPGGMAVFKKYGFKTG